jgi:outer membrane protein assembly factor BamD
MQVGMAHHKLMEKADRDNSHAEAAEDEFRTFLMKYPQSPFVPQAEQSMRNVQEVLAQGEYGIARFYYMKKDYRASAARLVEVTGRYPLFSSSDDALWMLGDIYQRARQGAKNEDAKNQMGDLAAKCYDRIIQDYPGSSLVPGAKERLKAMNMPIPAPNPDAVQRMKQQQMYEKEHRQLALLKGPMNMVKSGPDVSLAAHSGPPNLAPPDDIVSAMDVLTPGASGPSFSVRAAGPSTGGDSAGKGGATTDSESVETEPDSAAPASTNAPAAAPAAQIVEAPGNGNATAAAETPAAAAADPPAANAQPVATAEPAAAEPAPAAAATAAPAAANSATAQTGTSTAQAAPAAGSTGAAPSTQAQADKADPNTESTSKKKKGLHKIIPF